jgi:AbrB family looped-hinge helix DNA binding protein
VIPKEARQALDLKPGDKLLVAVRGDSVILLKRRRVITPLSAAWQIAFSRSHTLKRSARIGMIRLLLFAASPEIGIRSQHFHLSVGSQLSGLTVVNHFNGPSALTVADTLAGI